MKQEDKEIQQRSTLVKSMDFGAKPPGLNCQLCHLLVVTLDKLLNLPLPQFHYQ